MHGDRAAAHARVFATVDMAKRCPKGHALGYLLLRLAGTELSAHGFGLASPRDAAERGSQVSLTHSQGYAIMQAVIAKGVIGDFRAPDILRLGFTPLYIGAAEVDRAVEVLAGIRATGSWDRPYFKALVAVS